VLKDENSLVVTKKFINRRELISVYPYWLDTVDLDYLGLLQALVVANV